MQSTPLISTQMPEFLHFADQRVKELNIHYEMAC